MSKITGQRTTQTSKGMISYFLNFFYSFDNFVKFYMHQQTIGENLNIGDISGEWRFFEERRQR